MTNELVKKETSDLITKEKVNEYINTFLTKQLNQNEAMQFIEIATAFQLNPFKREIYCIPYTMKNGSRKLSILTGYEVYLKRAERLNKLDGWAVKTIGTIKDHDLKAVVEIFRKDWKMPFVHEVYFSEYVQDSQIWRTKPMTMIKKVAIAQGFRLAFPDEMGGMPYTSDELPDEMTTEIKEVVNPVIVEKKEVKENNDVEKFKNELFEIVSKIEKVITEEEILKLATIKTEIAQGKITKNRLTGAINYFKKNYNQFLEEEVEMPEISSDITFDEGVENE